jgi:C4-dicarboxylate transporter DctM subunit
MVLTFIIGGITPPVGITLYVASAVGKIKLGKLLKEMYPFITLFALVLFAVAYVPGFSLLLPSLFA